MKWYLIEDPPGDGAYNMAVDHYLMGRTGDLGGPILRLYRWIQPTLSIGRNQRLESSVNIDACGEAGVPIIRRMTGGQAVLHGTDLTYAVTAPLQGAVWGTSIMSTYKVLSRVFLRLFGNLDFAPTAQAFSGRDRLAKASPVCFATPSAQEILIDGKKLVGSAQRRRHDAFIQHGSIPFSPQGGMLAKLLKGARRETIDGAMTDLESMGVWKRMSKAEFQAELIAAFEAEFQAEWVPLPWGDHDEQSVRALRTNYAPLRGDPPVEEARAATRKVTNHRIRK